MGQPVGDPMSGDPGIVTVVLSPTAGLAPGSWPSTETYTTTASGEWLIFVDGYADPGSQSDIPVPYTLTLTATKGYFQWPAPASAPAPAPAPTPKPSVGPCSGGKGFPRAHVTDIGRTSIHNYQSSVEMVACDHFGYSSKVGLPVAGMVCGIVASSVGWGAGRAAKVWTKPNLALLGPATDAHCTEAEVLGTHDSGLEKLASTVCSWAADLLGDKTPSPGFFAGIGCAAAPVIGTWFGTWLENRHEHDVALGVTRDGKCVKYSPSHIPSPWLSVDCSPNDRRFR